MQCRNPKTHETHWHVAEAGGIVYAQGQCPGRLESDTTPHADRDRSEAPWWPPAAPGGYIHTTEPSHVVEPYVRPRDLDEPVPFVLTDEPQGERVRFPLDEGDPGTPLLPVAPEGIVLRCSMCPATLADTRGGVLWHNNDGSHTLEPSGAPAGNPLHGMPADRGADGTIPADDEQRRARYAEAIWGKMSRSILRADAVMAVADAEQADLRARLEALADEWDERADEHEYEFPAGARVHRADAQELRDALKAVP